MKLILLKENIKEGLGVVERAITENSNLPVLKNILLTADDGKLKLTSTNLEMGVFCFVAAKIQEPGSLTVPFPALYNIVANCDSERINLETDKLTLLIKTDNYEAKLQGINSEEFPVIPPIEDQNHFLEVNAEALKNGLLSVINAAQLSEIRPEISGVLLDFQITAIKITATDSFRLAEKTLQASLFKTNYIKGFRVIIPLKSAQEVIRIFPNRDTIKIHMSSSQIAITTDGLELTSRLIDGHYPDYEAIVPKKTDSEISINRNQFMKAVKLVSGFSGKSNDIKIRAAENNKALQIYSLNQQIGENTYLIPVKIDGIPPGEVSFNWRYLLDGLKVLSSENIFFGLNGDQKPAILKSQDDLSYFYVIMPIKGA